jgi:small basic protein (TIGR04137 family)
VHCLNISPIRFTANAPAATPIESSRQRLELREEGRCELGFNQLNQAARRALLVGCERACRARSWREAASIWFAFQGIWSRFCAPMSQHPSLKGKGAIKAKRSVLKRFERVELMKKRGQFKEGQRVIGLPKTKPED